MIGERYVGESREREGEGERKLTMRLEIRSATNIPIPIVKSVMAFSLYPRMSASLSDTQLLRDILGFKNEQMKVIALLLRRKQRTFAQVPKGEPKPGQLLRRANYHFVKR